MSTWPDKPLIRVVRGREYDEPVRDVLATRSRDDEYLLATGPRAGNSILRKASSDDIDEWEEVTAVPTARLEELKKAWHGDGEYTPAGLKTLGDAVDPILSHLPADKPSALDRAVTRVKETKTVAPRLPDFDPEGRLALLLGDLATLQAATHQVPPLISIVRVCTEWVDLIAPGADALSEVKARAESDPDWGGFTIMASLAGDIAAGIDDGMSGGPMKDLLAIAQYALAWAAQIIEEEDR